MLLPAIAILLQPPYCLQKLLIVWVNDEGIGCKGVGSSRDIIVWYNKDFNIVFVMTMLQIILHLNYANSTKVLRYLNSSTYFFLQHENV